MGAVQDADQTRFCIGKAFSKRKTSMREIKNCSLMNINDRDNLSTENERTRLITNQLPPASEREGKRETNRHRSATRSRSRSKYTREDNDTVKGCI